MLYSPKDQIAFAHFPKTAGTSIEAWFEKEFPDAKYVEPEEKHLCVSASLGRLSRTVSGTSLPFSEGIKRIRPIVPVWFCRLIKKNQNIIQNLMTDNKIVSSIRIIGVMREPFEMLVSLYEYWQRCDWYPEPLSSFICAARREKDFQKFLYFAIKKTGIEKYEGFFNYGGPAWRNTRLIDYNHLEAGLQRAMDDFKMDRHVKLERLNSAPRQSFDLTRYREEAGSLWLEVRRYFKWYYNEGQKLMLRG